MSRITNFPASERQSRSDPDDSVSLERLSAIKSLIKTLSREEQEHLLRYLTELIGETQLRRGDVLGVIAHILPRQKDWTVGEIKQRVVEEHGLPASSKEIYNALGYLSRTGRLQRVGYGQYIFNGVMMTTSEDFGGEVGRHEDLSDFEPADRATRSSTE